MEEKCLILLDKARCCDLYNRICEIVKVKQNPTYATMRKGEITHSFASIKKAETMLNFSPQFSIEEGLKQTIDWYFSSKEMASITQ